MTGQSKILFICNSLEGGGAERVFSTVLLELESRARDADIHVALLDDYERKYPLPDYVTVHQLRAQQSFVKSVTALGRLVKALRPERCVSFLTRANCANVITAFRNGHKAIISERVQTTSHFGGGIGGLKNRLMVRALYPRAAKVIAVSQGIQNDLSANYGVSKDKIDVIYNPYKVEDIRANAEKDPDFTPERPYIVGLGRLTENKNFKLLINAYGDVSPEYDLVILGEGPQRGELEDLIKSRGLNDRIHLPGFIENPYPVIKRAIHYVCSSNAEGFPNAVVEAILLDKAVVSSNCDSGPAEVLGKYAGYRCTSADPIDFGILFPTDDRAALAEALTLMGKPETLAHYTQKSIERQSLFQKDQVIDAYWSAISDA